MSESVGNWTPLLGEFVGVLPIGEGRVLRLTIRKNGTLHRHVQGERQIHRHSAIHLITSLARCCICGAYIGRPFRGVRANSCFCAPLAELGSKSTRDFALLRNVPRNLRCTDVLAVLDWRHGQVKENKRAVFALPYAAGSTLPADALQRLHNLQEFSAYSRRSQAQHALASSQLPDDFELALELGFGGASASISALNLASRVSKPA